MKKMFSLVLALLFVFALSSTSFAVDCSLDGHMFNINGTDIAHYTQDCSYPGCTIDGYEEVVHYGCAICGYVKTVRYPAGTEHSVNH